jgi:hypothetical protein
MGSSLGMAICAPQSANSQATPVEVQRVGDDALTSRLRDALEDALKNSGDFMLSDGKKPGTLIVKIPNHVSWKNGSGGRTHVLYKVEFATVDAGVIGRVTGSCWEDSLSKCAARVIIAARNAVRKLH